VRRIPAEEARAQARQVHLGTTRRRYKVDLKKKRNLLPGEVEHVGDMVIVLKLSGYSKSQIGRTVGISLAQVDEFLADPEISHRLVQIREALPQAALDLLQGYMVEAVQAIVMVMRESEDDKIILTAAGEILDRAGLSKASRQERHQINEQRTVVTDDGLGFVVRRVFTSREAQSQ
jgi:hypothetical protein